MVFLAPLPLPLALFNWSPDEVWGLGSALLGSWFIVGNFLALWGGRRNRAAKQCISIPVITPVIYVLSIVAFVMGVALRLSLRDLVVPLGQAMFVLGLIVLLAFAAVEFLFFIALLSRQERDQ